MRLFTAFLVFCVFIAKILSQTNGFSISLIPIDEVDKTLFPENFIHKERYQRLAKISRACVHQLESATSLNLAEWKQTAEPYQKKKTKQKQTAEYKPYTLRPKVTMDNLGYFIASLTVGSYSYAPYSLVDTGNKDTGMQCEGCTECFHVRQGNFNRLKSATY